MLTCIARSKQAGNEPDGNAANTSNAKNNQAIKSFTSQLKDMALKASGAYKHCAPCSTTPNQNRFQTIPTSEPEAESDRFRWQLKRTMSSTTPRTWGKEMEARLKGISSSSGEGSTPASSVNGSGRRVEPPIVLVEESEPKEWVAQVEPGVLITFVSLTRGGNDLRRIRFRGLINKQPKKMFLFDTSRDMFNKWQAQKWWAENYDKVMELYNVQRLSRQAFPLPTPPTSEDESSKMESAVDSPVTPPLNRERLPRRPTGMGMSYSSSDSLDYHHPIHMTQQYPDSVTPKLSSISGAKTEISSSMDASMRSSSSMSTSNASDMENEWVEQDEPGVYITIRALAGGKRELRRVRFSREKFGEMHARLWWEENRARIHQNYL